MIVLSEELSLQHLIASLYGNKKSNGLHECSVMDGIEGALQKNGRAFLLSCCQTSSQKPVASLLFLASGEQKNRFLSGICIKQVFHPHPGKISAYEIAEAF